MEELDFNQQVPMSSNFEGLMSMNGLSDFMNQNNGVNVAPVNIDNFSNQYEGLKPVQLDLHNPDYSNQFIDRYKELNAYDDYGFDPMRDNEKFYNEHTSGWDNFQRAYGEMWGMVGTSMFDTFTFGAFSDETAEKMKIANAIGQSTKGGIGAFALNTMVSAGYTLGIVFESLLEEATLTGLTILTRGTTVDLQIAETARLSERVVKALYDFAKVMKNQSSMRKTMTNLSNIHDLSSFATSMKNIVNPFENTISAIKDIKSMENMKNSAKAMSAFAGAWRDVTAAKLVATESMLEGNFAEHELRTKLIDQFIAQNGRRPNEDEMRSIDENALSANLATAAMNAPMIHLTNKLTFGLMTRPLRSLESSFIKVGGSTIISSFNKETGKRVFRDMSSDFWKKKLELLKTPKLFVKEGLKYSTDNFAEGFQEIAQDAISTSANEMYGDRYNNAVRGSWYNYLAQGAKGQMNMQGFETFASGFVMQLFVKPITNIGGFITQGGHMENNTLTGKAVNYVEDKANKLFRSEENYKKYNEGKYGTNRVKLDDNGNEMVDANGNKITEHVDGWMDMYKKEREQLIEQLNEFFSTPEGIKEYFSGNFDAMLSSGQFANLYEGIKDENGNPVTYTDDEKKNIIRNHYTNLFTNAIEHNQIDAIVDTLKDMKNMSDEDLAKAWSGETKDTFKKNIDLAIDTAQSTQRRYEEATTRMRKPHRDEDIKKMMEFDINRGMQMTFENMAYSRAIRAYVYNLEGFEDGLEKQQEIMNEAAKIFNSKKSPLSYTDFTTLYDKNSIISHINDLKGRLNGVNGEFGLLSIQNPDANTKKLIDYTKSQLDALELISNLAETATQDSVKKSDGTTVKKTDAERTADVDKLSDAVKDYLMVMAKSQNVSVTKSELNELGNAIAAYHIFSTEQKIFNDNINILSDPKSLNHYIENEAEILKYINEHKKEEIRESLRKFEERGKIDKIIKILAGKGIYIPKEDYDKMLSDGKMTSHVYAKNPKTGEYEAVRFGSKEMKEAYKVIHDELLKEGKEIEYIPIPEGDLGGSIGYRSDKSKRTMKEIMDEYGIKSDGTVYNLDEVMEKVADNAHKHATTSERELVKALLPQLKGFKVKFNDNQSSQFIFNGIDTVSIDLRYFSREYSRSNEWKNGTIRFEFGLCKAAVSIVIQNGVKKNQEFNNQIERLRKLASDHFNKLSDTEKARYQEIKDTVPYGLNSNEEFVVEAMCNKNFQELLKDVEDDAPVTKVDNAFTRFIAEVISFLSGLTQHPHGDVLHSALYVITDYMDNPILPIRPEQAGSVQGLLLSTNDSINDLKIKTKDDPDVLHKIVVLYKRMNNNDKSLFGKSDKEILNDKKFADWFKVGNDPLNRIIDEFNQRILNNVEPDDLEIKDIAMYPMTQKEYIELQKGNVSNTRKFIIAAKKKNNQALDSNEQDAYELNKEEIDKMVDDFNNIDDYKGPDGKLETLEQFTQYCIKKLGYNKTAISNLNLNDIKRIVISNISASERSESVKNNATISQTQKTIKEVMKDDFDDCVSIEEAKSVFIRYSNIRSSDMNCGFTYDDLVRCYNSTKNRLLSPENNPTMQALLKPCSVFYLYEEQDETSLMNVVIGTMCINGRRKVVYQKYDSMKDELSDEIYISFADDIINSVSDIATDMFNSLPFSYYEDINAKEVEFAKAINDINDTDAEERMNKMHEAANMVGFKIVTFDKQIKESDVFESIKNSCK